MVGVVRRALARATGINDPSVILPSDDLASLGPSGFDDFGHLHWRPKMMTIAITAFATGTTKIIGSIRVLRQTASI